MSLSSSCPWERSGERGPPRAASPPCPAPRRGTALRGGHVLPPDAWGFAFARRSCPRPVGTTVAVPTFQHRFSHADNTVAAITDELPRRRASRRAGSFFGHEAPGTRWVALSAWRPAFWTLSGARLCPPFVRAASTPTTFPPALLTPLPGRAPRGFLTSECSNPLCTRRCWNPEPQGELGEGGAALRPPRSPPTPRRGHRFRAPQLPVCPSPHALPVFGFGVPPGA